MMKSGRKCVQHILLRHLFYTNAHIRMKNEELQYSNRSCFSHNTNDDQNMFTL